MTVATAGSIGANLEAVKARVAEAARRAGRDPAEITVVGVTKTVPPKRIREGIAAGLRTLGENKVQEAASKIGEVGGTVAWHLIGHLQSNKAREAVGLFDVIQSVDSLKLAGHPRPAGGGEAPATGGATGGQYNW